MIDPPPNPCIALAPINQVIDFAAPQSAAEMKANMGACVSGTRSWMPNEADCRLTGTDEKREDTRDHQGLAADDVAVRAHEE